MPLRNRIPRDSRQDQFRNIEHGRAGKDLKDEPHHRKIRDLVNEDFVHFKSKENYLPK